MQKLPKTFPKTISILGRDFKIELVKGLGDTEKLSGSCDGHSKLIRIDADLPITEKWDTLLHESLHAAFYISGLTSLFEEEQEESVVTMLESFLYPHINFPSFIKRSRS